LPVLAADDQSRIAVALPQCLAVSDWNDANAIFTKHQEQHAILFGTGNAQSVETITDVGEAEELGLIARSTRRPQFAIHLADLILDLHLTHSRIC